MGAHLSTAGSEDIPLWLTLVLEFSSSSIHIQMPYINRIFHKSYQLDYIQCIFANCLTSEFNVYVPKTKPYKYSWMKLYRELYHLRHIWAINQNQSTPTNSHHTYKINVFSRFKPHPLKNKNSVKVKNHAQSIEVKGHPTTQHNENDDTVQDNTLIESKKVVLPLHQRLALIKLSSGLRTNREAIQVLMNEGSWFAGKENSISMAQSLDPSSVSLSGDKPLIAGVHSVSPSTGKVVALTPDVGLREFSFESVFDGTSTQAAVYHTVAGSIIADLMNGFNASVIVYGQTGSGKTHTMFGADEDSIYGRSSNSSSSGIVPRAMADILAAASTRSSLIDVELSVSYVEVYGELVTDLLRGGVRCGHSKVAAQRYVLNGAAEKKVNSIHQVNAYMREGEQQKRKAATAMNDRSTRAHSILIIRIKQRHTVTDVTMTSSLFLVDLGGSEQVRKSGVAAGEHSSSGFVKADNMREAVNINLGLLALKKCIDALNSDSAYVPYQDSKLTMLLSEGLGGNCKTSVIVCASMDSAHISETLATLRFGEKCSKVEKDINNQSSVIEAVLRKLDEDISRLEAEIKVKERWVLVEKLRDDAVGSAVVGGRGTLTIKETMLVGAEKERRDMQDLLAKRYELTGQSMHNIIGTVTDVVGFGKNQAEIYGLGKQYIPELDLRNERFGQELAADKLPKVVLAQGGKWKSGSELENDDEPKLSEAAVKAKRNKLVYAGLSV